ncbi:hypothetical protein NLX85_17545 [Micromonospora sp. A3M-1-15]|uniref:hypothetical protein n=1 Tax=Micromonospora sp. A3M-1-15 TaxID=2962035 RepID=UPI0020B75789|nr:hypothetical protein [Micromonospora sp. A3M-1-15]MCP3785174.1 hypothetical protein [Micromonospora sp. A3M-1-15]
MSTSTGVGPERVAVARVGMVAVVAHHRKTLSGGLDKLWAELAGAGVEDPIW